MLKKTLAAAVLSAVLTMTLCAPALAVSYNPVTGEYTDNTSAATEYKVKKVKMSVTSTEMEVGQTKQLSVKFTPAVSYSPITWRSGSSDVATVDENGLVTAVKVGDAIISATTESGHHATCRVTVHRAGYKPQAKDIELSLDTLTVRVNQTRQMTAYLTPGNTYDQEVTWTSSNPEVVTVDHEGVATGVSPGSATITVETHNGYTASCKVTVPGNVVSGLVDEVSNTQKPGSGEALSSPEAKTQVEGAARLTTKGSVGSAVFENKTSVSAEAIAGAAYTAESMGRTILMQFNTLGDNQRLIGRLTFNPADGKNLTAPVGTGVYTASTTAKSVQAHFEKYFSNRIAVIHQTHTGAYPLPVELAARVDLSGMDTGNLKFYRYDTASNRCELLGITTYTWDKTLLRFSPTTGGVIVVSDGPLKSK